jgi:hypothetical protein
MSRIQWIVEGAEAKDPMEMILVADNNNNENQELIPTLAGFVSPMLVLKNI